MDQHFANKYPYHIKMNFSINTVHKLIGATVNDGYHLNKTI